MIRLAIFLSFCVLPPSGQARERLSGPVPAKVVQVRDGDTVVVDARIWPGQTIRVAVRLRGIDTPEIKGKCAGERRLALAAKRRVATLVAGGDVRLKEIGGGKYFGRILAVLENADGQDVGGVLKAEGLAQAYGGGKRGDWCANMVAQK